MPRFRSIGFIPAARYFSPSWIMLCASTVAVVVPSPAISLVRAATSRSSCAPMFSNRSSSSIDLATTTRTQRDLHRVGECINAAADLVACVLAE